ncbi:energy-coupled thiamine transporter ThiT [Oceanirhabdus sp. W0125-5]|uniref:energy-coupled thiamine transporter ThiT n=1 Tax=Oceanirhabdus sp. W0125-5 TaxID=2999116 RepID=UPI0022F2D8CF|nr:energy-coupled thiamine transporter ThiT [Oceanirhabdus sp. W0125-5]WBW99213.1 energy-coupled thiamine transporter ThiT [Oceanirhabdus sp. W0125-5]
MNNFLESIKQLIQSPFVLLALAILFIITMAFIIFKKVKLTPKLISIIGVVVALTFVLNLVVLFKMPQGGSVTLGSMVPIIILALIYGPEVGFLAGFIFGLINLLVSPYIVHPIQVLFDYPLPFMMLGLAGFFKYKQSNYFNGVIYRLLGVTAAVFGRFIFHWLSGVIFFGQYAPEGMSPYWYSFIYNGSYLLPEYIICILLIIFIPFNRLKSTSNRIDI